MIVQNLINNADADGIDKIVFPPVDRILERRFGGEKLKYALQNKSLSINTGEETVGHPLYKAYAIALPKVLDQFEKTYGTTDINIQDGTINHPKEDVKTD